MQARAALFAVLLAAGGACLSRPCAAQVSVQTQVSSRRVEVDQPFSIQLNVTSSNGASPTNARLPAPPGVRVIGPRVSTQTQVTITNGQMVQQSGVTLTFTLTASKPGSYRIGPASVDINGTTERGQPINVEVVAAGSLGPRGHGNGSPFDPFDPFGAFRGMPGFPNFPLGGGNDIFESPQAPSVPPEYQIDHAPDASAFLIAKVNARRVVVGQPLDLRIYAYGGRGPFDDGGSREPSRDGFLAYDVDNENSMVSLELDGRTWIAVRLKDTVLVPIHAGKLTIGPMRFGFRGRGYSPAAGGSLMRESQPVEIDVVEPPLAGRPPGYHIGDVGRYTLKASVDPRSVRQGEAVAVIAELEGVGNVPSKLDLPQQNGVDWMDPTQIEKVEAHDGNVRGSRTFTYVAKVDKTGSVDLGDITLPYYNPDKARYEIARATLGKIEVHADPKRAAVVGPAAVEDRLRGLLRPPQALGRPAEKQKYLADSPSFFWALAAGPLAVLASSGLARAGKLLRERGRKRRAEPLQQAQRELERARSLSRKEDRVGASAALERALHLAIEGSTGLKSRGVLRSELGPTLCARGLDAELANGVVASFEELENARFVGEAGGPLTELVASNEKLMRALEARRASARERSRNA